MPMRRVRTELRCVPLSSNRRAAVMSRSVPFCTVPIDWCHYSGRMQVTSGTPVTAGGILKDAAALIGLVTMDNVGEFLMVQAAERKG